MLLAQHVVLLILFAVILVFICLFSILVFAIALAPWVQAYVSEVPIPLLRILAMRLRGINVGAIVRALVIARAAGVDLSCSEMEWASRQGVDPERVTRALIEGASDKPEIAFRDLVRAELEGRRAEQPGR